MTDEEQSPSLMARVLAAYAALPSATLELQILAGGTNLADASITLGSGGRVAIRAVSHGPETQLAKERFMTYDGALVSYYDGDPEGHYFQVADSTGGRMNAFRACDISVGLKFIKAVVAFLAVETPARYNALFGNTLSYSEPRLPAAASAPSGAPVGVFIISDEMGDNFIYRVDPETSLLLGYTAEVAGKGEMEVPFRYSNLGQPIPEEAFKFTPAPGTTPR